MTVVLNQIGQTEIPRELREQLGFQTENVLELQSLADTLVAWKKVEPDLFEKWRGRGSLPAGTSSDDYLRLIRDGDSR
jgi:bifunctional DNA-binding transcriptional regulator/antitoxin component of YhaV-PrlF toxin-antitoxin module